MKCKKQTSGELRNMLFEEIADLRSGNSTPGRGRAVASLANAIVGTVIAEAEMMHQTGENKRLGTLNLGGEKT